MTMQLTVCESVCALSKQWNCGFSYCSQGLRHSSSTNQAFLFRCMEEHLPALDLPFIFSCILYFRSCIS